MITRCSITLTPLTPYPVGKGQRVGVTRGDLSDSIGILINIRHLTLRSQFCFYKTFIGGQDATIVWFCNKNKKPRTDNVALRSDMTIGSNSKMYQVMSDKGSSSDMEWQRQWYWTTAIGNHGNRGVWISLTYILMSHSTLSLSQTQELFAFVVAQLQKYLPKSPKPRGENDDEARSRRADEFEWVQLISWWMFILFWVKWWSRKKVVPFTGVLYM